MNKYLKLYESHSQYVNPEIRPNVSYCKQENEVHYNPRTWADAYFTIESIEDNNTIYLKASNASITKTISVSTDNGSTWTQYTSSTDSNGTTLVTLNEGDKLLVKGENSTYASSYSLYNQFKTTGQFEVKGNIMSLINGDSFANSDELTVNYTFGRLFYQCTGLTSAENLILPATTLTSSCYYYMFQDCTNLTTAPELPATTLTQQCYSNMFSGCTSLIATPELPATTLAMSCYSAMFYGCTSLTTAPELPATTLVNSCYQQMFQGCTSLTTAPELPTTTLELNCYNNMFRDCTSLTVAPELPATTLEYGCYSCMFYGCTSLTTAPELPATTLATSCYEYMFQDCTRLNYIKAMFTTTPSKSYTDSWVKSVASSGTFVKNSAATWTTTGVNGIPTGWTVQTATE